MLNIPVEQIPGRIQRILEMKRAFLKGHFVLSAWDHSGYYVNLRLLGMDPEALYQACRLMARHFLVSAQPPEIFVGMADNAIDLSSMLTFAYNRMRAPGTPKAKSLYISKDPDSEGRFLFRRGQGKEVEDQWVVLVEDLGTTGTGVKNAIQQIVSLGGRVIEVAYAVKRGRFQSEDIGGVPIWTALDLPLPDYKVSKGEPCELCDTGVEIDEGIGNGGKYVAEHGQPPYETD